MALLYLIIWAACSDTELLSLLSALSFYFYIYLKLVRCHTNLSTNFLTLNNSNKLILQTMAYENPSNKS